MANVFTEDFEGTNGVSLTTANTAFTGIVKSGAGATGAAVFDTSTQEFGSSSGKFSVAASTDLAMAENTFTDSTKHFWRGYFNFAAAPSANVQIASFKNNAKTVQFGLVVLNSTGTLKLQDSAGVIVGAVTAAITANTWFRVEVDCDTTATTLTMRVFYGANVNGSTADETRTKTTNLTTAARVGYVTTGIGQAGATSLTVNVDQVDADDTTSPGPANPPPAIPVWAYSVAVG